MIQPIVLYGDKILRYSSDSYKQNEDVSNIVKDLWDTMHNAGGWGLAAPQIDISKKIFVVDIPDENFKQVFINPIIKHQYGSIERIEEGCLSIPGITGFISRERKIEIHFYDENWKFQNMKFQNLKARVIQHEYDHLNGTLWIDRVDLKDDIRILPHLLNITKRNIEVFYPIK
jgi:peptide deformylase